MPSVTPSRSPNASLACILVALATLFAAEAVESCGWGRGCGGARNVVAYVMFRTLCLALTRMSALSERTCLVPVAGNSSRQLL